LNAPVRPGPITTEAGAVLLLAAVGATLGALAVWGPALGIVVALLAVGDGVVLRYALGPRARPWAVLPFGVGLGILAVGNPYSVASALLAGAGGIGILLWLVPANLPGGSWSEGSRAVLLPALGLLLVLGSATVLAGLHTYVGVAVLLWIALLIALLWIYAHPRSFLLEAPRPSDS
jgi:hypothetical protein